MNFQFIRRNLDFRILNKRSTAQDVNGPYNKTGTSKVGAISKAQKAQNIFFFGKKLEIFEKFFLSENVAQCRKI